MLEPGDLLLLFTDGVTEIRGADPDLGERALEEVLAGLRGASAEEVVAAVEQRAVELQAGDPRDDIALLAVKVAGVDSTACSTRASGASPRTRRASARSTSG